MGKVTTMLGLLLTHPSEFRTLLQFYLYHEQKRDITATQEHPASGWDRQTMRRCWEFLDKTSRSFSAVIKELEGDLARTVSVWQKLQLIRHRLPTLYSTLGGLPLVTADLHILPRFAWSGYHRRRHDPP